MQPPAPITDAFRIINYAEAGLWAAIGLGFAVQAVRRRSARLTCLTAAAILLAFGASDVVETRTGAWWHPWWLLAWKAACVIALLLLVIRWRLRRGARLRPSRAQRLALPAQMTDRESSIAACSCSVP